MQNLFDYDVYDRNGEKVGSVENVWANDSGEIGFIGISTGWLGLGKNHLIPGDSITVDHDAQTVTVPYDEDTIKNSSSFESMEDLDDDLESRVYTHYGVTNGRRSAYSDASASTEYATTGSVESANYASTGAAASTGYAGASRTNTSRDTVERGETVEVPLAEERLNVEKRQTSLGEVRLRKVVRTETINQPVELRHEDVVIERVTRSSDRPGEDAFVEKVISIPLTEEEAVLNKTVHSAGAVKVDKVVETEQKTLSGTVRKEDVEVDRDVTTERKVRTNLDT